jgi:hypothetical protein
MTIPEPTLQTLRNLIEKNPALLAQLQHADDAAASARILSQAANAANLPVEEAALRIHLEDISQRISAEALSDAQLDKVAGGGGKELYIVISVLSLGIGCAVVSAMNNLNPSGGKHFMDIETCPSR